MKTIMTVALLMSLGSGCAIMEASSWGMTLTPSHKTQCEDICNGAGMTLSSIVVTSNRSGCVCQVSSADQSLGASAASAAMTVIAQSDEEAHRIQSRTNH